jgi:hypothetical protein
MKTVIPGSVAAIAELSKLAVRHGMYMMVADVVLSIGGSGQLTFIARQNENTTN